MRDSFVKGGTYIVITYIRVFIVNLRLFTLQLVFNFKNEHKIRIGKKSVYATKALNVEYVSLWFTRCTLYILSI